MVTLGSILDLIGLTCRRPDAAESRVPQGREVHSVHVLVPDSRGLDQNNFHDVTIVDMGDVPKSSVSLQELSLLRQRSSVTWCGYSRTWK